MSIKTVQEQREQNKELVNGKNKEPKLPNIMSVSMMVNQFLFGLLISDLKNHTETTKLRFGVI